MSRYYLNVVCDEMLMDPEGIERSTLGDAINDAILAARELMSDCITRGMPIFSCHQIQIADEDGTVMHVVPFATLIDLRA